MTGSDGSADTGNDTKRGGGGQESGLQIISLMQSSQEQEGKETHDERERQTAKVF